MKKLLMLTALAATVLALAACGGRSYRAYPTRCHYSFTGRLICRHSGYGYYGRRYYRHFRYRRY
jgi:hypothetical protein